MKKIKRALLSVSDKSGLVDFASYLASKGVEILSTGGTAKALAQAGLKVIEVSAYTGFDEILDGRVKTLHPKVHAGILYRRDLPEHQRQMAERGFGSIDLLAVNLYPFEATVAKPGVGLQEAVENIDIGGPCMLRAAAKNFNSVTAICDPGDYEIVRAEMEQHNGGTLIGTRRALAAKIFARTSSYDKAISDYLNSVK